MGKSEYRKRRALSAAKACWQSARCGWRLATTAILTLGAPIFGAQASQIQTLPLGAYSCELPGDALHAAGRRVVTQDFAIVHSSTYESAGKQGSYLLTANIIEMTSGPLAGERFHRISDNFLRKLSPDGTDSELRCIRRMANDRQ